MRWTLSFSFPLSYFWPNLTIPCPFMVLGLRKKEKEKVSASQCFDHWSSRYRVCAWPIGPQTGSKSLTYRSTFIPFTRIWAAGMHLLDWQWERNYDPVQYLCMHTSMDESKNEWNAQWSPPLSSYLLSMCDGGDHYVAFHTHSFLLHPSQRPAHSCSTTHNKYLYFFIFVTVWWN